MILTIKGNIPNKKDLLRPGRKTPGKRGLYYEKNISDAIAGIVLQLQAQWKTPDGKQRPPLECAAVSVYLYRKSGRFDPDGQLTVILDALKQAGVIVDDNAARVPELYVRAIHSDSYSQTEVAIRDINSQWPQPKRKRVPKAKQR